MIAPASAVVFASVAGRFFGTNVTYLRLARISRVIHPIGTPTRFTR
jgi:hypothetical protein